MIRGIDTQMLATKPADSVATQSRMQKQDEMHMQQHFLRTQQDAKAMQERTVAAAKTEGERINADDGGKNGGGRQGQKGKKREEPKPARVDPMLSLPVERGRYAKREQHFIDLGV
ncbi:hypothetical protein FACS1894217_12970 [Clostridia bacterium]|nr:hypothetical protein FACS1894217_12970 [Clostridia bacterium]